MKTETKSSEKLISNAVKPAYPTNARMHSDAQGLTKRELFAMAAMQGIASGAYSSVDAYNSISRAAIQYGDDVGEFIARKAANYADELLKQLGHNEKK